MGYVLELISPEDKASIMKDLELLDEQKWALLRSTSYFDYAPNLAWAIDHENRSYIFGVPRVREESEEGHYYFRFEDKFYDARIKGLFDSAVILDASIPRPDLSEPLTRAICLALNTYGRFGCGNSDPLFQINPYVVLPSDQGEER